MTTFTYTKPTVGGSEDTWGDTLNANWDAVAAFIGPLDSTELAVLDGITASTAELNTLTGLLASTTELNYVDGVTSNIQTQIDNIPAPPELTQVQVEDDTSTVFGQVSGQRLGQAIAALAGGGLVPITQAVAASDASIEFTALDSSIYDHYLLIYSGVIPAQDGATFRLRIKEDGAGSFATSGYFNAGSLSEALLATGVGSAAGEYGVSGFVVMTSPHRTDVPTSFIGISQFENSSGNAGMLTVAASRTDLNAAIEAQFSYSTGNIDVGTITMYGISKV